MISFGLKKNVCVSFYTKQSLISYVFIGCRQHVMKENQFCFVGKMSTFGGEG